MRTVKSRWSAFFIHLGFSFSLFIALAAIIKFMWYPGFLFTTEGGWNGIKLIAGVDLVIGPLLTLICYNIAKPELKRDLSIILVLQLSCIVAGMAVVAYHRPAAVIYANKNYFTITRSFYDNYDIDIKSIPLLKKPWPVWIALDLPTDPQERSKSVSKLYKNKDMRLATDLYRDYWQNLGRLANEGEPLRDIPDYLKNKDFSVNDYKEFTLVTRYALWRSLVNVKTGKMIVIE